MTILSTIGKYVVLTIATLVFVLSAANMASGLIQFVLPHYPRSYIALLVDLFPEHLRASATSYTNRFYVMLFDGYMERAVYPWWLSHSTFALVWCCTGILQFVGPLRRNLPIVHRNVGRVFLLTCTWMAISGLVLGFHSLVSPQVATASLFMSGTSLYGIWMAWTAIKARNISEHRKWATRVAAWQLGPPLQRLVTLVYIIAHPATLHKSAIDGALGDAHFSAFFVHTLWIAIWLTVLGGEIVVALTCSSSFSAPKKQPKKECKTKTK